MSKSNLTLERLRELLSYDPDTGVFTWRVSVGCVAAGTTTGSRMGNGYLLIRIDRCAYLAHRLAWFYMTGAWPSSLLDHEDRDRGNNRWCNLREATHRSNGQNSTATRNKRGDAFRGIYMRAPGKWQALIKVDGRQRYLGQFPTPEQASAVYEAARAALHPFFQPA